MKFNDTEVERVYELNFRAVQDSEGEDQRQICGLFAAFDWFRNAAAELVGRVRRRERLGGRDVLP